MYRFWCLLLYVIKYQACSEVTFYCMVISCGSSSLQCNLLPTGGGTLRKKSLAKARSILGSLWKWATGPCGESCFSGAGSVMTLTPPGLGTDTLARPFWRRVLGLYSSHTHCCKGPSRETAGLTWLALYPVYRSFIDTSLEQACKYASAQSSCHRH